MSAFHIAYVQDCCSYCLC